MLSRFAKKRSRKKDIDPRSLKHLLRNEGFSTAAINKFLGED